MHLHVGIIVRSLGWQCLRLNERAEQHNCKGWSGSVTQALAGGEAQGSNQDGAGLPSCRNRTTGCSLCNDFCCSQASWRSGEAARLAGRARGSASTRPGSSLVLGLHAGKVLAFFFAVGGAKRTSHSTGKVVHTDPINRDTKTSS